MLDNNSRLQEETLSSSIVWLVGSATCDILIAGCMLYFVRAITVRIRWNNKGLTCRVTRAANERKAGLGVRRLARSSDPSDCRDR